MTAYLVIVLLVLPGQDAPRQELQRQLISASSQSVCQAHADKLAEEQRRHHAEVLQRLKARVHGVCVQQGEMA